MDTVLKVVGFLFAGFILLNVGLTLVAQRRAAKLEGQPLPALPGALGQRIARAQHGLVYFFTPQCGACRPVTPRMQELARKGQPVFPVDAMQDQALAKAFSVMATPTTVEVADGRVVAVHIGPVKPELWARYGAA